MSIDAKLELPKGISNCDELGEYVPNAPNFKIGPVVNNSYRQIFYKGKALYIDEYWFFTEVGREANSSIVSDFDREIMKLDGGKELEEQFWLGKSSDRSYPRAYNTIEEAFAKEVKK